MESKSPHDYFARAYKTGSDIWTKMVLPGKGSELLTLLPNNAFILDLGTGRGRLLFDLVERGFRVIGLENISHVVERGNGEIKNRGYASKARFLEGDARAIPLADGSFDAVIDIGLLQHLGRDDWSLYASEVARILKSGGIYYAIEFARETPKFLTWVPRESETGDFTYEDTPFHFFSEEEMTKLMESNFELHTLTTVQAELGLDKPIFIKGIWKKK